MDVKETEVRKEPKFINSGRSVNVYPKKHYWCGFDIAGRQKWYIELTNGRLVSSKDENYFFWLKKFSINEKQSLLEHRTKK
jgi:hypothetical protein